MSIIGSLLGGGISGAVDSVTKLAQVFVPNKTERESNIHDEQMSVEDTLAAEASAQQRESRTTWDSFIDGLNRLPRPIIALGVLAVFVWCPLDPVAFSKAMTAYQLVPEWLALLFAQVIALFFGGRMLQNWTMKPVDPKVSAAVLAQLQPSQGNQNTTRNNTAVGQSAVEPLASARSIDKAEYQKQMADTSRPLSLDAIVEWNRQRSAKN